jgi:hypothetical protein
MQQYVPEIVLWLFVINLGIAFGAGLYEKRIILPQWFPTAAESGFRVDSEAISPPASEMVCMLHGD